MRRGSDDWDDDDWEDGDNWVESRAHRPARWIALMLGVVAAAVFGPSLVSNLRDDDRSGGSAERPGVVEGSTTTVAPVRDMTTSSSTRPPVPVPPTRPSTTTTPTPVTTPATTPLSAASAAAIEVSRLQTVPALRDVIVTVNGTTYASDAAGVISLAPADRHGIVEVVGVQTTPPLLLAEFTGWGDGQRAASRSLDTTSGPVAQLGFSVSYRVRVDVGVIPAGGATVEFESAAGSLILSVQVPEWVVGSHALRSPTGLVAEPLTYTAVEIERGGSTATLTGPAFAATPEAVWQVLP